MLKHHQPVANANSQGPAGAAFANDGAKDGHIEPEHFSQVIGDRLALAQPLGIDPRPSTGRVNKGNDRHSESIGMFHQAHGLAIAAGGCHAKIPGHIVFGVAAFLVAQNHHGHSVQTGHAAHDRWVISPAPIAVQLQPIIGHGVDVVQGAGAAGMASHLQPLHRRQTAIDLLAQLVRSLLQLLDLIAHIHPVLLREATDPLNALLQIHERLFKVQIQRFSICSSHRSNTGAIAQRSWLPTSAGAPVGNGAPKLAHGVFSRQDRATRV